MVHGLQQPGVVGLLRIHPQPDIDINALAARMSGFIETLPEADDKADDVVVSLIRRAMQWAIALQRQSRLPLSRRYYLEEAPQRGEQGWRQFVFAMPFIDPKSTVKSLGWVLNFIRHNTEAAGTGISDAIETALRSEFDQLQKELRTYAPSGLNRYYIHEAALERDVPIRLLTSGVYSLGTGCLSRWFMSSITDLTPSISVSMARDKVSTATVLRQGGLPAPIHQRARAPEQAVEIAGKLGYPVVVKPTDLDQGQGVAADLRDDESVAEAFREAAALSKNVIVEKHFSGFTHRLTVFQGHLVKVAKRVAGGVSGDGIHTVSELVAMAQQDPFMQRRTARLGKQVLAVDDEAIGLLTRSGLTPESIPAPDEYVRLRRRDNVSAGGHNVAIPLADVHPDNRVLAVRAAALLRLDFAGVDLIIGDITQSWLKTGALICEVNAQPQMGTKDSPEIYQELLAAYLPENPRIPVHLLIPAGGRVDSPAVLAKMQDTLSCTTLATADGIWLEGQRVSMPFAGGYEAAAAALASPDCRALLFVMPAQEIIGNGLPIDRIDSISVTGMGRASPDEKKYVEHAVNLIKENASRVQWQ